MTGIRKRVTIGFLSIVALLFFSGLVSLFELSHMSNDIEAILDSSRKSIEMSKNMLDAIQNNERSVTYYTVLRDSLYADSCRTSLADFDVRLRQARSDVSAEAQPRFDSLDLYTARLNETLSALLDNNAAQSTAVPFDGRRWYNTEYAPLYDRITDEITNVMGHVQSSLNPRAERLSRNAYRSVTPVFISLVVMIVILLLFYYFVMIYTVKPIIEMNRRLGDYIRYKLPFDIKAECQDEMRELKEKIESMVNNPSKMK